MKMQRWTLPGALLIWAFVSPYAHADKVETLRVLLHKGDVDAAQARCERWEVEEPGGDEDLREVCAQVAWRGVESSTDYQAWRAYRETWAGTTWESLALTREAEARLQQGDTSLSEQEFLDLAETYKSTDSHASWMALAADAAVRDVADGEEAIRVALAWPEHTALADLVERYPKDFFQVRVADRGVELRLVQDLEIELKHKPVWSWMARDSEGFLADWDSTVVKILGEWGAQPEVVAALPVDTGLARLPICRMIDPPGGWEPVLEIRVGESSFQHLLQPDADCGENSWPVFLSREDGRAVGISLRPGHRVDLRSSKDVGDIRDLVQGVRVGDVVLGPDGLYQQHAAIQVVQPLSGGAAWTTLRSAGQWSQPLGSSLHLDPVPTGWELVPMDGSLQVRSEALAKMPLALRDWRLVPGDVGVVPLQMRDVIGLNTASARPPTPSAPQMTAASGWVRSANGGVETQPPQGAGIAGIYQLGETERQIAEGILAAMSLTDDSLFVLDGWKVDLDRDRVEETILRAGIEGRGIVFVIDTLSEARGMAADNTRVFGWFTPLVGADGIDISTPFPFQKGGFTYLAWVASGSEGVGIEVLRTDGTGFTSDAISIAAP